MDHVIVWFFVVLKMFLNQICIYGLDWVEKCNNYVKPLLCQYLTKQCTNPYK